MLTASQHHHLTNEKVAEYTVIYGRTVRCKIQNTPITCWH